MKWFTKVVLAAALIAIPAFGFAGEPEVPAVIGYHSAIYDEGGNAIQDGEWDVAFRITDASGSPLYEEVQRVTAVGGQISALIGNGLDPDGAPTGGVPMEAMDPTGGRYLEVLIDGMDPMPAVELAAVPYAAYCQVALTAAEGSIDYDDLADGVVDEIAKDLTGGIGREAMVLQEDLDTIYSAESAASVIGVATADIQNSTSSDLQNVLGDLDGAIASNSSAIASNANQIAAEESARISAIETEAEARESGDDNCVSDSGDTVTGTLFINADIEVADGYRIDGYDVGDEITSLNERTANFTKVIWGSVTGGTSPSIIGPNVDISYITTGTYGVTFNSPMPSGDYAVVLTPTASSVESAYLPRVYDKHAGGFTVQFYQIGTNNFDFIAIGN